ncbi:unnamed protein product [Pleuronectes platessa]|uniref:Uncharacterized protein n=1 Tax=Pleuronectes platessa TaxID=8262 RepID=A0A9N7UUB1_PLEPL|nr:unnamed protein product [Pleuronectes platessa]
MWASATSLSSHHHHHHHQVSCVVFMELHSDVHRTVTVQEDLHRPPAQGHMDQNKTEGELLLDKEKQKKKKKKKRRRRRRRQQKRAVASEPQTSN